MKMHRDLNDDDFMQVGDEIFVGDNWTPIPKAWIGLEVTYVKHKDDFPNLRRPLEIPHG